MGGCSQLLPWDNYEVWVCWIEGSGSCQAPNTHNFSHTISDNIWKAYADSWYRPRTIANASSDFSTRKYSIQAGFRVTTVTPINTGSLPRCGARFDTSLGCRVCWIWQRIPRYIASLVYYYIEFGYGRKYADGSQVASGIDSQIVTFDDLSLVSPICLPILPHVSVSGC